MGANRYGLRVLVRVRRGTKPEGREVCVEALRQLVADQELSSLSTMVRA